MFEAFVNAVEDTFKLILDAEAHPVDVVDEPARDRPRAKDISAVIGFTGGFFGNVVLSFPADVAAQIVERCTGESKITDAETADAVAEFLNMISGAAKRVLARSGQTIQMSLPTVVIGRDHNVFSLSSKPCMRIDFESDIGPFFIQMSLEQIQRVTRILLVDDSRLSRRIMRNALTVAFEKAEFYERNDGADARAAIDELSGELDLMVLDFKMPRMTGVELLRAIRTVPTLPKIPVLFVTSDHTAERQLRELEGELGGGLGPCGLLLKPFDADEARDIARALIESGKKDGAAKGAAKKDATRGESSAASSGRREGAPMPQSPATRGSTETPRFSR